MRGIFHHNNHGTNSKNTTANKTTCVITHSPSTVTLADWNSWEDDDSQRHGDGDITIIDNNEDTNLPPIVDDCTELDHARRVEIATSHGFTYDEASGVKSILQALTPHELKYLADNNMPLRHYRAEKGNLNEAIRKIKLTLKWREEFDVVSRGLSLLFLVHFDVNKLTPIASLYRRVLNDALTKHILLGCHWEDKRN